MLICCRSLMCHVREDMRGYNGGRYLGYPEESSFSNPPLSRITAVDPFISRSHRFLKSANKRVTVSREAPIIWAISS